MVKINIHTGQQPLKPDVGFYVRRVAQPISMVYFYYIPFLRAFKFRRTRICT